MGSRSKPAQVERLSPLFLTLLYILFAAILTTGAWLARTNLRSGRGDRRGAFHLALVIAGAWFSAWVIVGTHRLMPDEVTRTLQSVAYSLLLGVLTGMFYIGLEPALRRRWPHRIVSWTRALDGRFRDPLVGRDLLAGAVATPLFLFVWLAWIELWVFLGAPRPPLSIFVDVESAGWGVAGVVGTWPMALCVGTLMALGFMILLLAITRLVCSEWIAATLYCGIIGFGVAIRDGLTEPFTIVAVLLPPVVSAVVMLRFGVLAAVTFFSLFHLALLYPVTGFSGPWYSGGRMTLMATVVLVAAYGAWCCARRPEQERG